MNRKVSRSYFNKPAIYFNKNCHLGENYMPMNLGWVHWIVLMREIIAL